MATSIGTAWIQIKPSLSGISKDIEKELGGAADAGSTKMNVSLKSAFSGLGSNLQSTFSDAFSRVVSTAKGLFMTGLTGTFGLLGSQLNSAFARIDTLNNATKMFTAMGYATDAVNSSMGTLKGYLNGLPTSLDSAVSGVQLLSASFGGIEKGTKIFQAVNNAGLAFGASTDMISNAITQLSQTSLDGPLDAQTWNSLRNSGFSPVFAAMAKEAGVSVGELKAQFGGNGTKTVQEFLDALIKMDEEGTSSMASLSEMARNNTEGIQTSFTNMKTAVTRALAGIVEGIPGFAKSIKGLGKAIEGVLNGSMNVEDASKLVGNFFSGIVSAFTSTVSKVLPLLLSSLTILVTNVVDSITGLLSSGESMSLIIDGFVSLFVAVAKAAAQIAIAILPLVPEIIASIAEELAKPDNAGPIIAGMGLLFGGTVLSTVAGNFKNALGKSIGYIFTDLIGKNKAADAAAGSVDKLGKAAKNAPKTFTFGNTLLGFFKNIGKTLTGAVSAVMKPVEALLKGLGKAIAGFFTAFASPQVMLGALGFAVAAAAVAAAILLIGGAIGFVTPGIAAFMDTVILPLGAFLVNTFVVAVNTVTEAIIRLTNDAVIPLGEFLVGSFLATINTMTDAMIRATQQAVIPMINVLSGAFINTIRAVGGVINNVLRSSLEGVRGIVDAVGDSFIKMGIGIRTALNGVSGILNQFRDILVSIGEAIIAVVALATGRSVRYGVGFATVTKAATGGRVVGEGTATSDSNLYALSNDEYVLRAAAARKIGFDNLDDINETGEISGGGTVNNFTINGYNKSPEELANIISQKIAFKQARVMG